MESAKLEGYLQTAQLLAEESKQSPSSPALDKLLELIEKHRQESLGNRPYEEFFKGESAFYQKLYDRSLKHYIQASTVPEFQFFCYRSSSFISKLRDDRARALSFAEKAKQIHANDPLLNGLLHELLHKNECSTKIEDISAETAPQEFIQPQEITSPSTKPVDLNPLTDLFQPIPSDEGALFSHEPAQEKLSKERANKSACLSKSFESLFAKTTNLELRQEEAAIATLQNPRSESKPSLKASGQTVDEDTTAKYASAIRGVDFTTSLLLEQKIESFQNELSELTKAYLDRYSEKRPVDHSFTFLQGWDALSGQNPTVISNTKLLTEKGRAGKGGYFLRWNNKGIVINPGLHFLRHFHAEGFHIRDIDFVIVTRNTPDAYADITQIYELNQQLNRKENELQIIHYYLNSESEKELAPLLKPGYKQARHTIHSLDLYLDSPDVEKLTLADGIVLNYFPASTYINGRPSMLLGNIGEDIPQAPSSNVGIRFDLTAPPSTPHGLKKEQTVKLGYLSGTGWNPLIAHHLGHCDVLIVGFGNTSKSDYEKIHYNPDCLGYRGSLSLFEDVRPKLLISSEFSGREGDIRLDVVRKLREEALLASSSKAATLLPGDIGLKIDLKELKLISNLNGEKVPLADVRVVKDAPSFGRLQYLSPQNTL